MKRIFLIITVAFVGIAGSVGITTAGELSQKQRLLLTAIDIPLTRHIVERVALDAEALMAVIDQPEERLYVRGRAIAALAMIHPPGIQETLDAICRGPYPIPLKQQAAISLARSSTRDASVNISERLLSLLSQADGQVASTIAQEISRLQP